MIFAGILQRRCTVRIVVHCLRRSVNSDYHLTIFNKRFVTNMPPIVKKNDVLTLAASKMALVATDNFVQTGHTDKIMSIISSSIKSYQFNQNNEIEMVSISEDAEKQLIFRVTGRSVLPLVFIKGDCIGGLSELEHLQQSGVLEEWLKYHQYELIVIGGGSGGMAAAKEAGRLGKRVACLDFVEPSPQGTTWGVGGTCVNVGCIPKKLMHQAAILGHSIDDAKKFGWDIPEGKFKMDWTKLRESVQNHIASLNWGYKLQLREKNVAYYNCYGSFTGSHEIQAKNKRGKIEKMSADRFLISTGVRPRYPDIPGAREFCISSDDLFSLPYNPGKTLCVGASYVSLECAGFLKGFGLDVSVMVRSILLRGFDEGMAQRIGLHMDAIGIRFIRNTVPLKFEQIEAATDIKPGRIKVTAEKSVEDGGKKIFIEEFDTVLLAIGRDATTDGINLDSIGVQRAKNKKLQCHNEQSLSVPYVYAIGDVLDEGPELTPVAIHAGKALMRRLFRGNGELTDYHHIPTTVFTPLEYGCCGMSEETAIKKFGKNNIDVFHNVFIPLEYSVPHRSDSDFCYCKLICNKADENRVVGFHILAPNAGEITQGFGIAFKLGGRKEDFDQLIGIHPTIAENFTKLTVTTSDETILQASNC